MLSFIGKINDNKKIPSSPPGQGSIMLSRNPECPKASLDYNTVAHNSRHFIYLHLITKSMNES